MDTVQYDRNVDLQVQMQINAILNDNRLQYKYVETGEYITLIDFQPTPAMVSALTKMDVSIISDDISDDRYQIRKHKYTTPIRPKMVIYSGLSLCLGFIIHGCYLLLA